MRRRELLSTGALASAQQDRMGHVRLEVNLMLVTSEYPGSTPYGVSVPGRH